MRLLDFVARAWGQHIITSGGGQCVDLCNLWLQYNGLPYVYRNAVDWVGLRFPGWRWVDNGPTNAPSPGAIVVWRPYPPHGIGPFGHVAVALLADANHLLTFDANWAASTALVVSHDYGGVAGWISPEPHSPPS